MKAEADRDDQVGAEQAGRNSADAATRAEADVATHPRTKAEVAATGLMEAVVERGNLMLAYQRVVENQGAAGVDAITVSGLKDHLKRHWPTIRARLLAGEYRPMAVRRVDIPKPQGGLRTLGIPTLVDRLIQQALHQVLQPIFEPTFSDASYGFRPGRNAHQALRRAQQYVTSGKRWVVDIDLEKFFDRVNHDLLMSKLAAKIGDARVLKADPALSRSRHDGGRFSAAAHRRHAARWAAVAATVQHFAPRPRQGAGTTRAHVLPLRGRLQHLCRERACRHGAAAKSDPFPKRAAQAQGECEQERGGAAVAA